MTRHKHKYDRSVCTICGKSMPASTAVKQYGIASLGELGELSETPVRTLQHWYKHRPKRFKTLCAGAMVLNQAMPLPKQAVRLSLGDNGPYIELT